MPRAGRHQVPFASVEQRSKCIRPNQRSSAHTAGATIHAELGMLVWRLVWTFKAVSVERVRRAYHDAPTPAKLTQGRKKTFMSKRARGTLSARSRNRCKRLARCFASARNGHKK